MNYILFDLEATCWKFESPNLIQETIEVGAVMLDSYGDVVETFNRFVKPILNPNLSEYCKELTGIKQNAIDFAKTFPTVIEDFQDWINIDFEDYLLCSWGDFDKKLLIQDARLHNLDTFWLKKYINLKEQYQSIKKIKKQIGLRTAVDIEGFEFYGNHHRAIDDAKNMCRIFTKYLEDWQF